MPQVKVLGSVLTVCVSMSESICVERVMIDGEGFYMGVCIYVCICVCV